MDARAEPTEAQLLTVLRHVAMGLSHIHSLNLVHLDIKPENLYVKYSVQGGKLMLSFYNVTDFVADLKSKPIFKVGDLGLLNEANDNKLFMEGDCRYI